MKKRIIISIALIVITEMIMGIVRQTADPVIRTDLHLSTVNGGTTEMVQARSYENVRSWAPSAVRMTVFFIIIIILNPVSPTKTKATKSK